ncbi:MULTISPECIES: hypothetical protein [Flavobacteriaceae]|uniref:hypothetical protein n=1 Tax=Flavobacteriaceae TaxID=49546 RepID=UPI00234AB4DF|nr:hypothetical protein [Muricauda sp. SP22]MDC6363380.1 hypothetical protein [Muricauda sp. SP22]
MGKDLLRIPTFRKYCWNQMVHHVDKLEVMSVFMKKKLNLIVILFVGLNCYSQSIATALNHDRKPDIKDEPNVAEITTITTYYRKNETEKSKSVSFFNGKNMLLSEMRYDDKGNMKARLNFMYDSTNTKSISRRFETWNRIVGHSTQTAEYVYDKNGHLIKTIDKNVDNQPFRITSLQNNDKGHPEKLVLKELSSNFTGVEIADYDYEKNIANISVLDERGNIISTSEMKINFEERKFDDLIYNEQGDLIKSKGNEYEYKYDEFNNWVKKTWYEYKNGKKRKYQVSTRKIKYRK